MDTASLTVVVEPATPDLWDDVATVFESGAIGNRCWCQWVRKPQRQARDDGPDGNRASLRDQVAAGEVPGMLAYVQGQPVGWCSVGPRETFGRLGRTQALTAAAAQRSPPGTWATMCFFVSPGHRRSGVARALLRGAENYARASGANAFEGFPVTEGGRKLSNDDAYPGTKRLFIEEGFTEVPSASPGRSSQTIMRKVL